MKFGYDEWVYVVADLKDSFDLNYSYQFEDLKSKAGRRYKIRNKFESYRYKNGTHAAEGGVTPAYRIGGVVIAEHELMSAEEHKAFNKACKNSGTSNFQMNAMSLL